MRFENSRSAATKIILSLSLIIGFGLAASSTTQAQYRNDRSYGYDVYRMAGEQGYRDGVDHGAEHAREGKRYSPESARHYKDATAGYRSEYGNKDAYKQAYREGFRQGYDVGYGRGGYGRTGSNDPYYRNDPYNGRGDGRYGRRDDYGRYGGNDVYRIAGEQGYRDGVDHGAEHAREGKRYNPESARHYKDADSGYRSEYGNKEEYKRIYREAFRRGYDEGFRRDASGGYRRDDRSRRIGNILGDIFGRP